MEAGGYDSLRGTSAMQEPSRKEQDMLVGRLVLGAWNSKEEIWAESRGAKGQVLTFSPAGRRNAQFLGFDVCL